MSRAPMIQHSLPEHGFEYTMQVDNTIVKGQPKPIFCLTITPLASKVGPMYAELRTMTEVHAAVAKYISSRTVPVTTFKHARVIND